MLALVKREVAGQKLVASAAMTKALIETDTPPSMEFVDAKSVKKWCDLQGKLLPLVEKFRQFQKEDSLAVGLSDHELHKLV